MMTTTDGGPAFPTLNKSAPDMRSNDTYYEVNPGMSLRDWFAGQALVMAGIFKGIEKPDEIGSARSIAIRAYQIADAMLAERNKP